jgi:hypothetical protein
MQDDPLVEEARAAGKAYIDSFKGDRQALLEDLRKREQASGRKVVYRSPKPVRDRSVPTTPRA